MATSSTLLLTLQSFVIPFLVFYLAFTDLVFGFVTSLFIVWICDYWRYKDFPPGPRGWPIVGSLFQLGTKGYVTLGQMSEKYGPVFSIRLGKERAVVLNDYESVREALIDQADVFSARPEFFVLNYGVKNRDITMSREWREQRKFMTNGMKSFGFGRSASETLIMDSVQMVMDDIDASKGAPLDFHYLFFLPILNVIWKYAADHPLPKNHATSKALCDMINLNFVGLGNLLVNFLPLLRFVPGGFGFWVHQREHKKVWKFLTDEIQAHRESFPSGQHKDFIDVYLQEIHNKAGTSDAGRPPYNEEHLAGTLYDLFLAGSETTSNTLLWGFLMLVLHPQTQQKVVDEMRDIIGERPPCFSDIQKLPYLEAFIMEVHRNVSLSPLSLFHAPSRDTTFRGYQIPKGTTVIQNIYSVHHDPKCWDNPEEFKPERFLNEKKEIIKPPFYMPFSVGPRNCPGEPMARMELHLFFGCLLHKYKFALPPGGAMPSLEPVVGLTLAPQPYSLCVTPRK